MAMEQHLLTTPSRGAWIRSRLSKSKSFPRPYDLRHTFSVLALQNGVDVKTLSAMLGHYSAGFTLDTYAHVTTSMQKRAANAVGNFLSGTLQP